MGYKWRRGVNITSVIKVDIATVVLAVVAELNAGAEVNKAHLGHRLVVIQHLTLNPDSPVA